MCSAAVWVTTQKNPAFRLGRARATVANNYYYNIAPSLNVPAADKLGERSLYLGDTVLESGKLGLLSLVAHLLPT